MPYHKRTGNDSQVIDKPHNIVTEFDYYEILWLCWILKCMKWNLLKWLKVQVSIAGFETLQAQMDFCQSLF
jgi:hypothetical protein